MKIAVDTCVGRRGRALLENAGHQVVVEACRQRGTARPVLTPRWFEVGVMDGSMLIRLTPLT
jgi:predicted ATPase